MSVDVARFRKAVRRGAADFIAQRLTEAQYLAAVRREAIACEVLEAGRRPTRADRVLRSLAWGSGSTPPGRLPEVLEPHLAAFEDDRLSETGLRQRVAEALDRVVVGGGR